MREKFATNAAIGQAGLAMVASAGKTMRIDWGGVAGPALAATTALLAILLDRYVVAVPNPAPLLICIVAFAGSLSGLGSAAVSAAFAILGSALFFWIVMRCRAMAARTWSGLRCCPLPRAALLPSPGCCDSA